MKSLSFSKTLPDAEMLVLTTPCRNICCKAPETTNSSDLKQRSSHSQAEKTKLPKEVVLAKIREDCPSDSDIKITGGVKK